MVSDTRDRQKQWFLTRRVDDFPNYVAPICVFLRQRQLSSLPKPQDFHNCSIVCIRNMQDSPCKPYQFSILCAQGTAGSAPRKLQDSAYKPFQFSSTVRFLAPRKPQASAYNPFSWFDICSFKYPRKCKIQFTQRKLKDVAHKPSQRFDPTQLENHIATLQAPYLWPPSLATSSRFSASAGLAKR